MNLRQIKCSAVLFALAALVSAQCTAAPTQFQSHVEGQQNRSFDRPTNNPSPQHILVIRGQKASDLELWLGVAYGTTNRECQSQTIWGRIAGAPDIAETTDDYVRVPKGDREFSVSFYLDRYKPGRCNWQPFGTYLAIFIPGENAGKVGISGLTFIHADGLSEVSIDNLCRRQSYETESILSCQEQGPAPHETKSISTEGGVINVNFELAP